MKVPGRVTSPGHTPGKDARQHQKLRPILIVLVLFVVISATVWGALFRGFSQTEDEARRVVQTACKLPSTAFTGDVTIEGEGIAGTGARVRYVDSTGSHTAVVRLGEDGGYSLSTCGR